MYDEVTRQREWARKRSKERFEAGLCIMCGQEWRGEFKTCDACRAKVSRRGKEARDVIKAQVAATGICYKCGQKPVRKGQLMCPLCAFFEAERANKYKVRRRESLRKQGLCERCANAPARPGRTTCAACAARESERYKKYYYRTKTEVKA